MIMPALVALLFYLAQPFWETKTPDQWTNQEIETIRTNSPWAQGVGPEPGVLVYFATAAPVEEAENELRFRSKQALHPEDPDYLSFLSQNREKYFVLAIPYPSLAKLGKAEEEKRLEEETVMVIGRKKFKMVGHFPPVPSDPTLRLVFPREIQPTDKRVIFRLSLPGIDFPDRDAEFNVKELIYRGKLAV